MQKHMILMLYAMTPTHAGSGKEVGVVDLPIQRERITHHPIICGVKGALRRQTDLDDGEIKVIFGPDTESGGEHAGSAAFGEARLLAFPMRSLRQSFAWVTCPVILSRFHRDCRTASMNFSLDKSLSDFCGDDRCKVVKQDSQDSQAKPEGKKPAEAKPAEAKAKPAETNDLIVPDRQIVLEEHILQAEESKELAETAGMIASLLPEICSFQDKFRKHLVLVADTTFTEFVQGCTEVRARVCLNDEKTVKEGPWYEEYLPAESILYAPVVALHPRANHCSIRDAENVANRLKKVLPVIQIGGNETIGCGQMATAVHDSIPAQGTNPQGANPQAQGEKE